MPYGISNPNGLKSGPTSQLGTPKLTPLVLFMDGGEGFNNGAVWTDPNSDENLAVRTIQQFCDIYEIGDGDGGSYLTIMVRDNTIPYGQGQSAANEDESIVALTQAVQAVGVALGNDLQYVEVRVGRLDGDDTDG